MFLKNKKNIFKIRRSKVADYAALRQVYCNYFHLQITISNNSVRNTITVSNSLDQVRLGILSGLNWIQSVCLYRLFSDDTSMKRV